MPSAHNSKPSHFQACPLDETLDYIKKLLIVRLRDAVRLLESATVSLLTS